LEANIEIRNKAIDMAVDFRERIKENIELPENSHFSSVGEYFSHSFNTFVDAQVSQEGNVFKETLESVFNNIILEEIATNGCESLNDLDFDSFKNYVDLPGNLTYQGILSYSNIVDAIHSDISKNFKLQKNHKVNRIVTESAKDGIWIHCENGGVFSCDVAVLTVSLEVLRSMIEARTVFEPFLPIQKSVALEHAHLSHVVKFFFKFEEQFPDPKVNYIKFNMSCKSLDNDQASFLWTNNIDRISNSEWWLIWIMGPLINEFENSPNAEAFAVNWLKAIQHHYKEFPQHLRINKKHVVASNWNNDPLYKGGYSYFSPGGRSKRDINILKEPITVVNRDGQQSRLVFSGEMTHAEFYSTTHAAFAAGIRDGEEVSQFLDLK